jgi:hypothetical protein
VYCFDRLSPTELQAMDEVVELEAIGEDVRYMAAGFAALCRGELPGTHELSNVAHARGTLSRLLDALGRLEGGPEWSESIRDIVVRCENAAAKVDWEDADVKVWVADIVRRHREKPEVQAPRL